MIADELRKRGLTVVEGRPGRGSFPITEVSVERTGTQWVAGGAASDINGLGLADRAMIYIEGTGRVWVLAEQPLTSAGLAIVVQGGVHDGDLPASQEGATTDVLAVLAHHTQPRTVDGDLGALDEPVEDAAPRKKPAARKKAATKETSE